MVVTFRAGYGRVGTMSVSIANCMVCPRKELPCLSIDSSTAETEEGYLSEYGPGTVCAYCVDKLFENEVVQASVVQE